LHVAVLHAASATAPGTRSRLVSAAATSPASLVRLRAQLLELPIELRHFFAKLTDARKFFSEPLRVFALTASRSEPIAHAIERARDLFAIRSASGCLTASARVGSLRDPTGQRWLVGPRLRTDPAVRRSVTRRRRASGYWRIGLTPASLPCARGLTHPL
jgi:hypothetical protein